jgi:hypothetical protein
MTDLEKAIAEEIAARSPFSAEEVYDVWQAWGSWDLVIHATNFAALVGDLSLHRAASNLRTSSSEERPVPISGYVSELGTTVRECLDCGCLVPGGPTRCKRCAEEARVMPCGHPKSSLASAGEGTAHCRECEKKARP